MSRIDCPRFSVHGDVLATFWSRSFNRANSRQGFMFLRKTRGMRMRGRAMRNMDREHAERQRQ